MSIEKSFRKILNNLDEEKKYMDKEVFENTPKRIEEFYKEFFWECIQDPYSFLKATFEVAANDLIEKKI